MDVVGILGGVTRAGRISLGAKSCMVLHGYTSLDDVETDRGSENCESVVRLVQSPEFGLEIENVVFLTLVT